MPEDRKSLAIRLRKEGKTYRQILAQIPVAKSTLSEWLKQVGLSVPQKQRITQLRINARLKGAASRKTKRLTEVADSIENGKIEVGKLSERELWLIGTALYWAEGSKQNVRSPSTGLVFGNMDFKMVFVFLRWLHFLKVPTNEIYFELYVHKNRKAEAKDFTEWWIKALELPDNTPVRIYFKAGNPLTNRSNTVDLYHGLLRIRVKSSTSLNRKVNGWIEGIANQ
jgi:hypothetical protein